MSSSLNTVIFIKNWSTGMNFERFLVYFPSYQGCKALWVKQKMLTLQLTLVKIVYLVHNCYLLLKSTCFYHFGENSNKFVFSMNVTQLYMLTVLLINIVNATLHHNQYPRILSKLSSMITWLPYTTTDKMHS